MRVWMWVRVWGVLSRVQLAAMPPGWDVGRVEAVQPGATPPWRQLIQTRLQPLVLPTRQPHVCAQLLTWSATNPTPPPPADLTLLKHDNRLAALLLLLACHSFCSSHLLLMCRP